MSPMQPMAPGRRFALSLVVMVATIMQVLDTTIANVALPHMQAALGATQESVAWVLTSYILASAIATPVTGWLENRLGRRVLFTICVAGFTVASVICGAAPTLAIMVVARASQGLFGALLLPLSQAVMLDIYPVEKRAKAMTIWSMGTMAGPISGPVLGGWLTENFNWRWVFYVNLPFGVVCGIALWLLLDPGRGVARRFDMFGFGLLATALASLQLLLDRGTQLDWFSSTEIVIEAALVVGTSWMFVVHTMTARAPLIPRILFRDRNFVTCCGLTLIIVGVMYSSQALTAPMLQQLLHYNTQQAGMLMMPRGVGAMTAMMVAGRLTGKVDARFLMLFGLSVVVAAQHVMIGFDLAMDSWPVVFSGVLQGFGIGFVVIPLTIVAYSTLPAASRTDAAAIFALMRSLSASVAIAIMGALVARNVQVVHSDLGARVSTMTMPVLDERLLARFGQAGNIVAAMVDGEVNRQALMIAYLNDFWLMMWGAALVMPLVLFMRPTRRGGTLPPIAD